MNIGVFIETGGINTLAASNLIIEQLATIDQAESWSRSKDIKFGIRHRMMQGKTLWPCGKCEFDGNVLVTEIKLDFGVTASTRGSALVWV